MGEHASKKLVRALLVPFDDDMIGLRGLLINKNQHKFILNYNLCALNANYKNICLIMEMT